MNELAMFRQLSHTNRYSNLGQFDYFTPQLKDLEKTKKHDMNCTCNKLLDSNTKKKQVDRELQYVLTVPKRAILAPPSDQK